jgi:putative oxidoreductase
MGMFTRRKKERQTIQRDLGVLIVRLTLGGLLAGHGAQKLFGSFGGHGLEGTAGWLDSIGFKPGRQWALLSGASEFGGGMMTALGLFHPVGPISTIGAMSVATRHLHWSKPIWVTEGGPELPVTNIAVALALSVVGPGRFSLDRLLGIRVPTGVALLSAGAVALGIAASEAVIAQEKAGEDTTPASGPEGDTVL